ncbi:peptidylprolyl isomerase [Emticicia sp. BO119]|uniref:peptidylprolyl isomerase n=1 Tax=Emticicia sp. BO119 TaxID=2757768 RepID=UPI0015EFEDF5|nr:peptidylprolyl isomerase [Emticicia sp. BO119]MBA4851542.1 peptidylprolyl isomerase [Emticicia sp. BO119]
MKKSQFIVSFLLITSVAFAQKKSKKDYLITLKTTYGTMHMVLFDDTPLHKANFIKLVNKKFFDSLLFHRVIENFMIQGGDPNSRTAKPGEALGSGGGDMERIPFEFKSNHVHTKGALAAARDGNPEKKSSACQFYIVQGKKFTDEQLNAVASRNQMAYSTEQRADYIGIGGAPHLDNNYTVFGEVIDNLGVIDTIAQQPGDEANRPLKDVKMAMTVKKMKKKKITKLYRYKYQ